jgi:acyl dehydratase
LITPLRPGDDMFLKSRIIEARPSKSNPDRGIVKIAYRVFNQKDETLATLTCASLVKTNPT